MCQAQQEMVPEAKPDPPLPAWPSRSSSLDSGSGEADCVQSWRVGVGRAPSGSYLTYSQAPPAAFTWEVASDPWGEGSQRPFHLQTSLPPSPRGRAGAASGLHCTLRPPFLRRKEEFGWCFQGSRGHQRSLPEPPQAPGGGRPAWSLRRPLSQGRGRWLLRVLTPQPDLPCGQSVVWTECSV